MIARSAIVAMEFCHQCVFLIVFVSCVMVASKGAGVCSLLRLVLPRRLSGSELTDSFLVRQLERFLSPIVSVSCATAA